ncbi:hypothetical protein MRX96_057207 [Rhipicephalus microplus]
MVLASCSSRASFLSCCHEMQVVPRPYRFHGETAHVLRISGECSYKLMRTDRLGNLEKITQEIGFQLLLLETLQKIMSKDDLDNVVILAGRKYQDFFEANRDTQR